jgi:hypothetical protein
MLSNLNPIFISGLYRSGTTALAEIIDGMENINVAVGSIHFMRLVQKFHPIEKNLQQALAYMTKEYKTKWKKNININIPERILVKKNELGSIYDKLMQELLNLEPQNRWAEKTNVQWESIPDFLSMFPSGQVVHIYRDPRSVAASFKLFTKYKHPIFLDCVFASKAMFNYIDQNKLLINNSRVKLIKFEDFFAKKKLAINDLSNFLKVKNSYLNSKIKIGGKNFNYNSSSSVNFTRLKNNLKFNNFNGTLSNAELYFIQKYLKSELKRFDYEVLDIKMTKSDLFEFEKLCDNKYLKTRLEYVSKFKNGQQGFPEDTYKYN